MAGKIQIAGIEHRCGTSQTLQNRRLKIVDHKFRRHSAKGRKGMFVAGQKVLHGLGHGEFDKDLAAEGQHHDEERKPPTGIAHRNRSVLSPVDLRALASSKVQLEIDRPFGGPDAANVVPQDRQAAGISVFPQTLEDLLRAIRVSVQQPRDAWLEGIEDAATWPANPPLKPWAR
jgi:hypothetical protein